MVVANKKNYGVWLVVLLVFISRLPFIFTGYGPEEDAWGLRITAESISHTGNYEVSRLPGHPLQEIFYSYVWQYGFVFMNLMTVIVSTAGILFFLLTLKKLNLSSPVAAAFALAFTPVIYINSHNVMDYTWAMSFALSAFYFLCCNRFMLAGLLIGCAVGCRITSGALLLPFTIYILTLSDNGRIKKAFLFILSALIVSCICFLPVYNVYGPSFFTYYQHFPIPSLVKNIYKGTIGVWGAPGSIATVVLVGWSLYVLYAKRKEVRWLKKDSLPFICMLAALLFIVAFARMPLKSAFMIPAIPFIILLGATCLSPRIMKAYAWIMVFSSLFMGINLAEPYRGSKASAFSFHSNIAGQAVAFDLLKGPVIADHQKQLTLIMFSKLVIEAGRGTDEPTVIVAGWFLNFINVLDQQKKSNIIYTYYIDESTLQSYKDKGYKIYYLPEQDRYNDLRFENRITNKYASPFFAY